MANKRKTKKLKIFKKEHSLKGGVKKRPVAPMNMDYLIDKLLPHLKLDKGLSLVPENFQAVTKQPRVFIPFVPKNRAPLGTNYDFRRDPDGEFCYICGEGDHDEFRCPFNYMYMVDGDHPCNARCPVEKHPMDSEIHGEFLRCFVRVNNMPPKLMPWHLCWICKAFGPVRMIHVPFHYIKNCRGFGYVIFWTREHAENAIEGLNGKSLDGYKLRLDWAYPCFQ